jgi:hypothetical protein
MNNSEMHDRHSIVRQGEPSSLSEERIAYLLVKLASRFSFLT